MAAGIVRRIDELGRIVIPKELRRTMRLREGDEMEILSSGDSITLKKYSGFESILATAKAVASLLAKAVDADVLFVSTEGVEIAEGKNKRHYSGARFTDKFANRIRGRRAEILQGEALKEMFLDDKTLCYACAVEPIINGGDLVGAVMLLMDSMPTDISKAYLHFCVELIEASLG